MASVVAKVLWLKSLKYNLSTVMLIANPILHSQTKHVELDINFVWEKVIAKQIQVQQFSSHTH